MKAKNLYATAILLMIFISSNVANATLFVETKVSCPISNEQVKVHQIISYGSYIYNWPSKYDLVFWPFTDEEWIWINPQNGYAAFGDDFEKLSDDDKSNLQQWLADNYTTAHEPNSHKEKLLWLEKVYSRRKMDDDFWCHFYRLMAFINQDDKSTSLQYVNKALPLLYKKLESNPQDFGKIETLYLLGEYNRRIGDKSKAKKYFSLAKTEEYKDKDGVTKRGNPYIAGLINDRDNSGLGTIQIVTLSGVSALIIALTGIFIYKHKKSKEQRKTLENDSKLV